MKKILLLLLLITGFTQAQIINFPDANFKAKLLAADGSNSTAANSSGVWGVIDTNGDGEIQVIEAQSVVYLDVNSSAIIDLSGISNFSNLKELRCYNNQLASLDLIGLSNLQYLNFSQNSITTFNLMSLNNLEELICGQNQLTSLDVTGCVNLKVLSCSYNQLISLQVNGLNNLDQLYCWNNQLSSLSLNGLLNLHFLSCNNNQITSLDITGLSNLLNLKCYSNQITVLNLSGSINLQQVDCSNNQINSLNFTGLLNLKDLSCAFNQLTSLNFSGLLKLELLLCSNNQLTSLDLSGNPLFKQLRCDFNDLYTLNIKNGAVYNADFLFDIWDNNPNLNFVCLDEEETMIVQQIILDNGLTNVNFNTYCTFTPGGDFNTITGSILFDANNNGCDASDVPQPFVKLTINDGTNDGATFDNETGNYTFYTLDGTFTVTPDIENPSFFNFSPVNAVVNFPVVDNSVSTQNFCITANGIHPDVEIVIAPNGGARPGFDTQYQIVYKNKGNQILSGDVNFTYDETVLDFVSSTVTPDLQSTGSLSWNYTNLRPFENRAIYVTLHANGSTDTPPVNAGDVLDFNATVNPVAGDEIPTDNVFDFHQTVVASHDPNEKTCIEGGVVSPSEIGNYLHYIINFENTGTALAENIVVKDTINAAMFDVKTLQIMNSSNEVEAKVTGNVAEFVFKHIKLPAGGHGNILLKIRTKTDLVAGDVVSNKADIFFDYNFPIETNVADTQFQSLGTNDYVIDKSISIYPNPTKGNVFVKANGNIKSVQLFDVQGRVLETRMTNEQQFNMDISKYSNGVYFLKVLTDAGIKTEKLIKN